MLQPTEIQRELEPIHMISGQLTDPGENFALVHGLTPVTVHMSFSLPWGNLERQVICCTTPGNQPCQGNFALYEQNEKVVLGIM